MRGGEPAQERSGHVCIYTKELECSATSSLLFAGIQGELFPTEHLGFLYFPRGSLGCIFSKPAH